jgi:hypothetical protein
MKVIRELMLQVSEVSETKNPFAVAKNMMIALNENQITSEQFELLTGTLEMNCRRCNIATENEIISLF